MINRKLHQNQGFCLIKKLNDENTPGHSRQQGSVLFGTAQKLLFIKTATKISETKAEQMLDIKEAVEELKLIKEGKKEARNAEDLIDEL